MTGFWRHWMTVWCFGVGAFGILLALGALPAADAPIRILFDFLDGPGTSGVDFTPHLRFSLAIMGPITVGWSITLLAAIRAANALGPEAGRPIWWLITISALVWYIIDSSLSVATGFWRNTIPNTVLLAGYLLPVWRTGVLGR